ncbi:MAG: arginase [Clostridiaceae bacterium]|jgi:arginase|nr:arginase [Clostridiaceae bacterium]
MNIDVVGVPIDLGSDRRGVDMGPSVIRYSGLIQAIRELNISCRDLGNISVPVPQDGDNGTSHFPKARFVNEITKTNEVLFHTVARSLREGSMPLVLGGDHSIATGSILGVQSVKKNIGVIWLDAHGDFNTEQTTLSGNLHGMSLAAATGTGMYAMSSFKPEDVAFVNPEKVVIIGARDLDPEEAQLLLKSRVTVYTMEDIDMYGLRAVMHKAIDIVEDGTEGFHLSFDMDVVSPSDAPGVGLPVKGGLTYREAHLAVQMLSSRKKLCSLEFVELNPIQDNANLTGELAVSLICSVLGKRTLGSQNDLTYRK